jgi:hypothetical protein
MQIIKIEISHTHTHTRKQYIGVHVYQKDRQYNGQRKKDK